MNFVKYLLHYLMFAGTMMFAAGAVADVGAPAEVPTETPETSDTPAEVTEAEVSETPEAEEETPTEQPTEGKLDSRTLPQSVKTTLEELKKTDPKAHTWLKDRLWAEKKFRDVVPGGIKEVQQMQGAFTSLREAMPPTLRDAPTEQVIQAVQEELSEGRALDDLFAKGDPNLFDKMIEFSAEGFKKLLPVAVNKYSQIDPEGYQHTMAQIFYSTLQGANVVNTLGFVSRLLAKGDTQGAVEELKSISEWVGSIGELAKKQPEVKAAPDTRAQELETREYQLWINETAGPINHAKTSAIKAELQQYLKGQTIDDETFKALESQCLQYVNDLLQADPNFSPTFNKYIESRDRNGLTRYMENKIKELLPSKVINGQKKSGPVEKAYKLFFRGTPTAKPAAKPVAAKPAAAAPKGWEKIDPTRAPAPHEIDRAQSPFEMIAQRAAILKSGKKVYWGTQAPA